MSKKTFLITLTIFFIVIVVSILVHLSSSLTQENKNNQPSPTAVTLQNTNPLSIVAMRTKNYPGSNIVIEQILPDGNNYHQYLTSYKSDGLKIYALLTLPFGNKPAQGWPVIIFNHGYIRPDTYQTFPNIGQYASYYPSLASAGYIVFKPDYRGNGNSEGKPEGAYYSSAYSTDDLNALSSIKKYKDANPDKIGMWGHSMGGNITLRDLVVDNKDIKAAVIWGGVVGSYDDLIHSWSRSVTFQPGPTELALRNTYRQNLLNKFGDPTTNPIFWNSIDPIYFVKDITAPIQLHAGGTDEEVPASFSQELYSKLKNLGKTAEIFIYPGDNHNISQNFSLAMQRSVEFFDKYLK